MAFRDPQAQGAYLARWKAENREHYLAVLLAWREKHRAEARAATRAWNECHRERTRENTRRWNLANADRRHAIVKAQQARKRGAGSHTAGDILAQLRAQRRRCYYCDARLGKRWHVDQCHPVGARRP